MIQKHVLSATGFLFIAAGLLLMGCQGETQNPANAHLSVPPPLFDNPPTKPNVTLIVPSTLCADEEVTFSLSVDQGATGRLQLQESTNGGTTWTTLVESPVQDCVSAYDLAVALSAGTHMIRGNYAPSNCPAGYAANQSATFTINVGSCCNGLGLEATRASGDGTPAPGSYQTYVVEYTVSACDQDYHQLKLQGGLVANARIISASPAGYSIKLTKKNTVITWNIGTMLQGTERTYTVTYGYTVPTVPGPTAITGAWSVKGKDSYGYNVEAGYNNAIVVDVTPLP